MTAQVLHFVSHLLHALVHLQREGRRGRSQTRLADEVPLRVLLVKLQYLQLDYAPEGDRTCKDLHSQHRSPFVLFVTLPSLKDHFWVKPSVSEEGHEGPDYRRFQTFASVLMFPFNSGSDPGRPAVPVSCKSKDVTDLHCERFKTTLGW